MAKTRTKAGAPLDNVRAAVTRMQGQAERMVGRLRSEAEGLIGRSRREVLKEIRDLERRVLKALRGATEQRVVRLERRLLKLEQAVAALQKGGPGA